YQPLARATKNPVWSVFGVQSSASRTVVAAGGKGVGPRLCVGDGDGDGAAEPVAEGSTEADPVGEGSAEAVALTDGRAPVGALVAGTEAAGELPDAPHAARTRLATTVATTTRRCVPDFTRLCPPGTKTPLRNTRNGDESDRPASFAGTNQIRFGGSVGCPCGSLHTISA